jgi:hypothetical protein
MTVAGQRGTLTRLRSYAPVPPKGGGGDPYGDPNRIGTGAEHSREKVSSAIALLLFASGHAARSSTSNRKGASTPGKVGAGRPSRSVDVGVRRRLPLIEQEEAPAWPAEPPPEPHSTKRAGSWSGASCRYSVGPVQREASP